MTILDHALPLLMPFRETSPLDNCCAPEPRIRARFLQVYCMPILLCRLQGLRIQLYAGAYFSHSEGILLLPYFFSLKSNSAATISFYRSVTQNVSISRLTERRYLSSSALFGEIIHTKS